MLLYFYVAYLMNTTSFSVTLKGHTGGVIFLKHIFNWYNFNVWYT